MKRVMMVDNKDRQTNQRIIRICGRDSAQNMCVRERKRGRSESGESERRSERGRGREEEGQGVGRRRGTGKGRERVNFCVQMCEHTHGVERTVDHHDFWRRQLVQINNPL